MRHDKLVEFWSKVHKTDTCWNWTGYVRPKGSFMAGYGFEGSQPAHRVSWEIEHGRAEKGMVVMHLCNNKLCVNPKHLKLGTHLENLEQAKRDGRFKRGDPSTPTKADLAIIKFADKISKYNPTDLCKYGHEFSGENVRYDERGHRICLACHKKRCVERNKRQKLRRREISGA